MTDLKIVRKGNEFYTEGYLLLKKESLLELLEKRQKKERSKSGKAVIEYAKDLVESMDPIHDWNTITEKTLLNGTDSWTHYSFAACSLASDLDICERICTISEQKRFKGGEKEPNGRKWLDIQANCLKRAARLILDYRYSNIDYQVEYTKNTNNFDLKKTVNAKSLADFLQEKILDTELTSFKILDPLDNVIVDYTEKEKINNFDIFPQAWNIKLSLEKIKKNI